MNKRIAGLAIVLGLLTSGFLQAQEKRPITLNEAIKLSLKNSKQLKYNQAKVEEATAALKEAVEKRLPDAKVSGSYLWLNNANIEVKSKNNNSGNQSGTPEVSQAMYGILNASLPIYTGGRIRYGIESSRYLAEAAKLDADNEREEVIQKTIEAYINLYKAKSSVSLVREDLAEAQQRVKDFSNLEKNGLLARNDLLKAQLQASNVELALLDAENNWQLANVNMNLLLGLPEKTELAPDSAMENQKLNVKTLDEYVQLAYMQRKDIASAELKKKAAETGVKATKGEYYPSLSLTGGYIAADIPKVLTVTNAVNIGAGVSYNIGSLWKTKAKVQQAEARAKQAAIGESVLNDNIRLQVNQAYLNWLSSQKKIDVYAKAVEQATENYRIVKNKYNNSLATTTDLLDADVAGLQARMNFVFAKADAVVAYNKLLQESGLLDEIENNK
ncbi:MAG TPA: TolC family protein [Chitinophagaceae bacterium]|jgi:outer membrane protein TolC|nr:TolC family protein [Chitinophagaceae bacterium]